MAHMAASLRHVFPTAIWRIPPAFFTSAIKLPPNKIGIMSGWHLPSSSKLMSEDIADRSDCPVALQYLSPKDV